MGGAREILIEGERDVKIDGGEAQIGEINRGGVTSDENDHNVTPLKFRNEFTF